MSCGLFYPTLHGIVALSTSEYEAEVVEGEENQPFQSPFFEMDHRYDTICMRASNVYQREWRFYWGWWRDGGCLIYFPVFCFSFLIFGVWLMDGV